MNVKQYIKKYRIYFALGLFLFVLIPITYFLTMLLIDKIFEINTKKQSLILKKEALLFDLNRIASINNDKKYIENNINKLSILLPGDTKNDLESKAELYSKLESIASEAGVEISLLTPDKLNIVKNKDKNQIVLKPSSDNYFYISIQVKGTFNKIMSFLYKLENLDYISDIISFNMEKIIRIQKDDKGHEVKTEYVLGKFDVVFYMENVKKNKEDQKKDNKK